MIKRPTINRRNRRKFDPSLLKQPSDTLITSLVISTVTVSVTVDQQFSLTNDDNGDPLIPQVLSVGVNGALPTAVAVTGPNTFDLTYAATQAASTDFIVPARDPAIRTYTGGWLSSGTFQP